MKDWRKALVSSGETILNAMRRIDEASLQFAAVVGPDDQLLGTVTDGDLRRGLLAGFGLEDPIDRVMNPAPISVAKDEDPSTVVALLRAARLRHVPLVDGPRIVGVETLDELTSPPERDHEVVLMAGGLGTRLLPLTESLPKPMLPVAGRPILEHVVIGLAEQGFRRFQIAVNYLGHIVEDYFGDGSRWDVSISYIRESKQMGTAGALSLMSRRPNSAFLVMNGDILTKLNFVQLMEAHEQGGAAATMCVRQYDHQIPFGVTRIDGDWLLNIEEKPNIREFVSAGIYVIEPEVVGAIPEGQFYDMPQLLNRLSNQGEMVKVFPITEYWLDVGRHGDMQKAVVDFGTPKAQ